MKKDIYLHNLVISLIREGQDTLLHDLLTKHNVNLEKRDIQGNTYLNIASQIGNKKVIEVLLLNGSTPFTKNDLGNTPLHHTHTYKFNA
jgi:ankyrin repeat protein